MKVGSIGGVQQRVDGDLRKGSEPTVMENVVRSHPFQSALHLSSASWPLV